MAGLLFFRIFGIHGDGSDPLRGLRPRAAGAASPPLPRPLRRRGVLPFTGSVFPPALVGSFHPILPDMQRREWTAWRRTGACCARGVGIARRPGCPPAEPEPRQAAGEASAHPGQMPADCRFHPGPPPPWAPDGRKGSAGPPARLSSPGRGPFRPVYGTNPNCKGDESGRCTTWTDRCVYSSKTAVLGKRTRRVQLGLAQRGGLPDRPRRNLSD